MVGHMQAMRHHLCFLCLPVCVCDGGLGRRLGTHAAMQPVNDTLLSQTRAHV